ncbi:hypothetical protein [Flavobacterium sp. UBA4854]|uniref:hypothetical protein n=1 Tax=Flavobacterium sp. UBA4854 TaxID=1946548 RepID=UPI0025801E7C|nr:hypothetical protein [Flavobacterium sp. UBA4854]
MSELGNIQDERHNNRNQALKIDLDLQKTKAKLDKLNALEKEELKGLNEQEREEKIKSNEEQRKSLVEEIEKITISKQTLKNNFENLAGGFLAQLDPVKKIGELNDNIPILMFPLRLETRFKSTGNQKQLWLRVYPDDCNINGKEDILSESELKNAKSFWIEMWKAGGIVEEEKAAWRSLVSSHGTGRSAWIIKEFKPTNEKLLKPSADYKFFIVNTQLVLSAVQKNEAVKYWRAVYKAKGNTLEIETANNNLVIATDASIAKLIQENYIPINISDEISSDQDIDKIVISEIVFPDYTAKQSSWTQSAKTIALPDKFVVTLYNGSTKKTILFDNPVKENLAVSVDPSLNGTDQLTKDANNDLILNEELSWMVDFEKALQVGMAIKIDLTTTEAEKGFEKLFVTGISFTSNEKDGQLQLQKLITNHFYSKNGFELLKQGTATNNTEDLPAGYTWSDDGNESYEALFSGKESFNIEDDLDKKSDGEKLADCLGIDSDILKVVNNANGKDQLEAYAMNTALFPATLGYFMEEMMDPLFNDRDIDATKAFFSGFVSGRGPIPAIRIGKQPYGILPISVYSKLNFLKSSDIQSSSSSSSVRKNFLSQLHALIMKMDKTWDSLKPNVAYLGKAGDAHQILMDVLGLHANSIEFHQRYAQTLNQLYNQLTLQYGPIWGDYIAEFIKQRGAMIINQLGISLEDEKLPILEKYFLSKPNLLKGPFIDDVPDSETEPIRTYTSNSLNYIEWLIKSTPDQIRTENFGGNPAPNALLYLLLKHSLMQVQSTVGAKFLIANNIISSKKLFHDPDFIHIEKNGTGKSKFEHLYNAFPSITGDSKLNLVDYIYKSDVLKQMDETQHLRETLDALKVLEQTPTARLERLLAEHLDCCNYRIDAWKTGLVQYKLMELRAKKEANNPDGKGIYLGAYGWLLDLKPEEKVFTDEILSDDLEEIFNKGNFKALQSDSKNLGYIHAPSLNHAATAAILRNAYDSNKNASNENPFAINLTSDRVRVATSFLEGMRNGQSLGALLGYHFERGLHDKYSAGLGEASKFIYPLRKAFPLVADNLKDTKSKPDEIQEVKEANNVLDGLKFINYVKDATVKVYPYALSANLNLPVADATQAKNIKDELDRIIDISDAISDLIMAEQVYQVVQGNFERASGNAEAISKGTYPPDIDIINTPRSGVALTNRMTIQFDANATSLATDGARSKAEPAINKWLKSILPEPDKILCNVSYSNPIETEIPITVSQKDLGLEAIDLLYVLNGDTEQAMTELDDRIMNFVRYKKSKHAKTEITINYTTPVNTINKSNVSFFELSALIKSLRKILIGAKFISPAEVIMPKETMSIVSILDDKKLKDTVVKLMDDDLQPIKNAIEIKIAAVKSIENISDQLKTDIGTAISDSMTLETIKMQLQNDLKEYLTNPVLDNKNAILTNFENSISGIVTPIEAINLKDKYEQYLLGYAADFSFLDAFVEDAVEQFLNAAKLDNIQTGTGFIYSSVAAVYDKLFSKINAIIERWNDKINDLNLIMTAYAGATTDEERIDLLKKAEMKISSTLTFPVTTTTNYKAIYDVKKINFDAFYLELKLLQSNPKPKVIDFIIDVTNTMKKLSDFDVILFDTVNGRNDCKEEILELALLKEGIVSAMKNLQKYISEKITNCTELIKEADDTVVNANKIEILLKAAKKILGEEALLLPRFVLNTFAGTEFENAVNDSDTLLSYVKTLESRLFPIEDWLGGTSRVREKVHHWENIGFLVSSFKPEIELDLTPTQFPYQVNDRWLAMKFRDENNPAEKDANGKYIFNINNDKLLYTSHFATAFDKTQPQCGILIDEWIELIPGGEETTGIAFHYDQPNSEPPQTMLLVTPPEFTGKWKWSDIIESMEETLEMAKKRAVEPVQIENTSYAQFLPTTMMAVTMQYITAATNLSVNNNIYKIINNES